MHPTTTRSTVHRRERPSTSCVDYIIDLPWRNFLSPEFGAKFQREVLLVLEVYPNFIIAQFRINQRKLPCPKKTSSIRLVVSIQYRLVTDRQRDRQMDGHTHDSISCASIASRGKKTQNNLFSQNSLQQKRHCHNSKPTYISCSLHARRRTPHNAYDWMNRKALTGVGGERMALLICQRTFQDQHDTLLWGCAVLVL